MRGWDGTSRLTLKTLQYSRLVHEYMVLVPGVAKAAAGGASGAEVPMQGSGGRLLRIVKGGSSEHDEDALFDAQMPKLTVEVVPPEGEVRRMEVPPARYFSMASMDFLQNRWSQASAPGGATAVPSTDQFGNTAAQHRLAGPYPSDPTGEDTSSTARAWR